jgi:hypothetical protein
MSYSLNYTGIPMPSNSRYPNVSGKDKNKYIYRVNDMMGFLVGGLVNPTLRIIHPRQLHFMVSKV